MPTGYTSSIKDGISFKGFALNCARAFGVCITMRDDPSNKPIPKEFKPSTYDKKELKRAHKELGELKDLTMKEVTKRAKQDYEQEFRVHNKRLKECRELLRKYKAMLAQVQEWRPPSSDHAEFKRFMVDQITGSIEFDCDISYYMKKVPKCLSGKDWLQKQIKDVLWDINYHMDEDKKEQKRIAGRNRWIKQLRDSLKGEK